MCIFDTAKYQTQFVFNVAVQLLSPTTSFGQGEGFNEQGPKPLDLKNSDPYRKHS